MRMEGLLFPIPRKLRECKCRIMLFIVILPLLFSINSYGQSNYSVVSSIDFIVAKADSLSNKSQTTFYLNKISNRFDGLKETWHYTLNEGKVIVFQVRYMIDTIEYLEIYYVHKDRLIFSEEYETVYFSSHDDELRWARLCHFSGSTIKQIVTLGNPKSRYSYLNSSTEIISRFQRRFTELQKSRL